MGLDNLSIEFASIRNLVYMNRGDYAAKSLKLHDVLSSCDDCELLGRRIQDYPNQTFVFITTSKTAAALAALPPNINPVIVAGKSVLNRLDLLLEFSRKQCVLGRSNCQVLFLSGESPISLTEENLLRRRAVKEENLKAGYTGPPSESGMAPPVH